MRHPIYTAIIAAAFLLAIAQGTAEGLAGAVLFLIAFWLKARIEENFLRAELGTEPYTPIAAGCRCCCRWAKIAPYDFPSPTRLYLDTVASADSLLAEPMIRVPRIMSNVAVIGAQWGDEGKTARSWTGCARGPTWCVCFQ